MPTRLSRAAAAGTVGVACVLVLRATGVFTGYAAVVLLALLVLAVPTSAVLSRRILLAVALAAGCAPLLWLVPLPTAGTGRTTVVAALLAGGLAAWVALDPRARLRAIVPRVRVVDLVPVAAGGAAAFLASPWLTARSPAGSLALLQAGWDNSAHFSMTQMIRRLGHTYEGSGPGLDGESWKFVDYPQGVHALTASIVELMTSESTRSVGEEIVAFDRAVGLVMVMATVLVAAGICSMPRLRRRPGIALVATSVVLATVALGPGAVLVANGFYTYYLTVALCTAVLVLALTMPRVVMPLHLGALLAALVAVTYGWVLLLALALPAAALVLLPLRSARWRGTRRQHAVCLVLVVLALGAAARAASILGSLEADEVLVIDGGIPEVSVPLTLTASAVAVLACLLWQYSEHTRRWWGRRETWLAAVPVSGIVVALAIAQLQWSQTGHLSYYFWKFAYGVLLLGVTTAALALAHVLAHAVPAHGLTPRRRRARIVLAVASAGVATQVFGATPVGVAPLPFLPSAPGIDVRADLLHRYRDPAPTLGQLVAAAELATSAGGHRHYTVLPAGLEDLHPISAAQWGFALSGTWTVEANAATSPLAGLDGTPAATVTVISHLLADDELSVVVTDPATLAAFLSSDPPVGSSTRIMTW